MTKDDVDDVRREVANNAPLIWTSKHCQDQGGSVRLCGAAFCIMPNCLNKTMQEKNLACKLIFCFEAPSGMA